MPTFNRDQITFHYLDRGSGFPFVFQHGLGGDVQAPLEVYRAQPGIRYLSMDARGHGATRPLGDPAQLRFDTLGDDVVALLDHLGLKEAVVGGISMGAGTALNLALRHPQRVRGLVLVRPAWLDRPLPANLEVMDEMGSLMEQYGAQEGRVRFLQSPRYAAVYAAAPSAAEALLVQFDNPRADETAAKYRAIVGDAPNRSRDEWAQISVPALVIASAVDPTHPLEFGQALAAGLPQAQFVEVTPKAVDKERYQRAVQEAIAAYLRPLAV